ncbi:MAG TPA: hypothetical protein VK163_16635 [Opitutaceae bacterium]|nr:hypothetical protein [Opitutaceae bacterium]
MSTGLLILLGERDPAKPAHVGIERAIELFNASTGRALVARWVRTDAIAEEVFSGALSGATGVWCTPGSPYASRRGALHAIRQAREHRLPFLGTCGGFQHALMEYCVSVLGHAAAHAEEDRSATDPLIMKLSCSLAGTHARVLAEPGSWYAEAVAADSSEEFNCNYGMAPGFEPLFTQSALEFVARDEAGQVRVFRLRDHPFYLGTLFQPERRALRGELHPLVRLFLEKAS